MKNFHQFVCSASCLALFIGATGAQLEQKVPRPPKHPGLSANGSKAAPAPSKLSSELRILLRQYGSGKSAIGSDTSSAAFGASFGISPGGTNPKVDIAVELSPGAPVSDLEQNGLVVITRVGDVVFGRVPVDAVVTLAADRRVRSIRAMNISATPPRPKGRVTYVRAAPTKAAASPLEAFDAQGLTGKGVIVGVIDTGIDWRHGDFRKPDGTTRILHLYDMLDNSFESSGGTIGSMPPLYVSGKPVGTLYNASHINAALSGSGTVASRDVHGHGTACAGTAAGNGAGTGKSVPARTYVGNAPEADLIVVRAGDGSFSTPNLMFAAKWILETAKALSKPCVLNMSVGRQFSAHDGQAADEKALDALLNDGKLPGAAICVSAGNEGADNLHAGGRFGPQRKFQQDVTGLQAQIVSEGDSFTVGYFNAADSWGAVLAGTGPIFLDANKKPLSLHVTKFDGAVNMLVEGPAGFSDKVPAEMKALVEVGLGEKTDHVIFTLSEGIQWVYAYGGALVPDGSVSFYLFGDAVFGRGISPRYIVGSPGNAGHVITVGAYVSRKSWPNFDGDETSFNYVLGTLAGYSSPGYRRDQVVKPDIAAPGTYLISSLAAGSEMGLGSDGKPDTAFIADDGVHLAWQGTSASSPYVAGVVALMLQKNPELTTLQIKDILRKTASSDALTGGVPNPEWGYGKINPAAALKATPTKGSN